MCRGVAGLLAWQILIMCHGQDAIRCWKQLSMRIRDPETGRSYFQKRLRRYEVAGHARELTFSCYHRYPLLSSAQTRQWSVEALATARRAWPLDLWAYVTMPEHVHLLVFPRDAAVQLGQLVGKIKEEVARRAIAYLAEQAPHWLPRITVRQGERVRRRFWQPGGGYDRNVVQVGALHQMIDYIHANPVRRSLVAKPEDWIWSSARWYAGIRPVPLEMDRTVPMYHYVTR